MNRKFQTGDQARWNVEDGGLCEIIKHLSDDFYLVKNIPEQSEWIGHESELLTDKEYNRKYGKGVK